jgi:ADP-ribosyl-[dinitrogen reductase] hydrolase
MKTIEDRLKGCLLGTAIGDAVGAPVEFMQRGTFEPVTEYRSGGKFRLNAGEWTDDTAMTLCLAQSLIDSHGFDPKDQLNKYLQWVNTGYMSYRGKMVGLGKTVMRSLIRYRRLGQPYTDIKHEKFSGNGSLMRLAPICIYYANDLDKAVHYAALSSRTTHGSLIAVDSCRYFVYLMLKIAQGTDRQRLFSESFVSETYQYFSDEPLHSELDAIIRYEYITKGEDEISSSGYAIHSLEAALWSFYHTNTFEEAILKAVNLGQDADTVGAITGQLAGVFYGLSGVPEEWVEGLCRHEEISAMAESLLFSL